MMDHIYNETVARDCGIERWNDLYDIALENAIKAAKDKALKDAIVLVARKSVSLGAMHVVSVLVNAEETKDNVEKMKEVLSHCMFKKTERGLEKSSLSAQIRSAGTCADKVSPARSAQRKVPDLER